MGNGSRAARARPLAVASIHHVLPPRFARHPEKYPPRLTRVHWCRRGDSNSHGFRHCPLKTACLPISPRRRVLLLLARYLGMSPALPPAGAAGAGALPEGAPGAVGTSPAFGAWCVSMMLRSTRAGVL